MTKTAKGYLVVIKSAYNYGFVSSTLLRMIKLAAISDLTLSHDEYTKILDRMYFYFGTEWEG